MLSMDRVRYAVSLFAGVPLGAAYGLFVRYAFGQNAPGGLFGTMTIGFIFVMPFVLGVIAVSAAPLRERISWRYGLMASFVSFMSCMILMAVFALEMVICL